ncbi:MAG: hypothetical protein PHP52_13130 [Bacteroidales bacterium]|nr:hypothetical protein [Bacteroidales bacterium]MDD4217603.1 hypothetical protein [Bacteroidales bacterium]
MFYKYKIILSLLFTLCFSNIFAQGELQTDREPDNYNLNLYGIKINSNGYGLYYNFSHRINYRLRNFIESEYNYQKHPKEIKVINPYFDPNSIRKFVFGKTHTVHNIKVGYGYNKMIYEKRDKNSISIHLNGSIGIILGVSKPIYYEIVDSVKYNINGIPIPFTSDYKIDINFQNNPTDIIGKAAFSYGLNELKFHPGLYAKLGLQFDFSQNVMKTQILETGVIFDSFLIPIEIMSGQESMVYLNLYIAYHFGKKYDANLNREYRKDQRRKN